jgi:hypothetical protein
MTPNNRFIFAFAVHDHQPVGNFEDVFARVNRRAYHPFLETAGRYRGVKFSLHISGALLEWMEAEAPETVALIRELAARGQCEILTGTYYESLAPVAPEEDVTRSLRAYTAKLAEVFGAEPKGMWLAERVYEPHLPALLFDAGVRYTALDDWHFRVAGIPAEKLARPWLAEHQGAQITVCPISQRLRYLVPFATPAEVITYLRDAYEAGAEMACLADDGEKFGEWPGTFRRCYEHGWLVDFFGALEENADWLRVTTLGEAVATVSAAGPAYLPATAYYEMTRWALPTDSQRRLKNLGPDFAADGRDGDLVAGGAFRSFFQKYEEANFFHKRVQETSRRFYEVPPKGDADDVEIQRHLWRAEANDSYWHGVFGGLYLPHLRRAVKRELLLAENLLERKRGTLNASDVKDFDADGVAEITLKNENVVAVLKANGLSVAEFSRRSPAAVLTDVPARRPEPYHKEIGAPADADPAAEAKTIHGPTSTKEPGLEKYIIYERRPKRLFLERVFAGGSALDDYAREEAEEFDLFSWGAAAPAGKGWRVAGTLVVPQAGNVDLEKEIALTARGLAGTSSARNSSSRKLIFGLEFTLGINAEAGEYKGFQYNGGCSYNKGFAATLEDICRIADRSAEWRLEVRVEPACAVWHVPLYTVSRSESGYEKVYQGSSFFFWWEVEAGGEILGRVAVDVT